MKKIFSFLLMAAMLLAVGASVTSCEEEDYGYYKVEKALFGEWESDELETNESNGIEWHRVVSLADSAERQIFS